MITLRPAVLDDARIMYEWQSAAGVRKFTRTPQSPKWSEHIEWVKYKLSDSNCIFNIIDVTGEPVGVIRLDRLQNKHDTFEISILIDAKKQGMGFASKGLNLMINKQIESKIIADVHPDNIASKNLFLAAGFQQIDLRTFVLR